MAVFLAVAIFFSPHTAQRPIPYTIPILGSSSRAGSYQCRLGDQAMLAENVPVEELICTDLHSCWLGLVLAQELSGAGFKGVPAK